MNFKVVLSLLCMTVTVCMNAQLPVSTRVVSTDLYVPWEILWGPDDRIWITERDGTISRIDPANGQKDVVLTVPDVFEQSESGLLGMALHPDFGNKPYVYIAYTYSSGGFKEKIVRYEYSAANDTLTSPLILLDDILANSIHDGCRLVFGPDGKLYITTGDAGNTSTAQNTNSVNGKVMRMNDDGSVPSDNPIPGNYLWSTGHRNAQGLVWANGILYSSEHGPTSDDEVNIIYKDKNYGWPNVAGFCDKPGEQTYCQSLNVVEPLAAWTPTLAVCGLDYYGHSAIQEWNNSLLMVNLKDASLLQMELNSTKDSIISINKYYEDSFGRIRDLCISPDGRVFIATSNRDGRGNPIAADDRIIEIKSLFSSIEGEAMQNHVEVYPNPANDLITISAGRPIDKLHIYQLNGKMIGYRVVNSRYVTLDGSEYAPGIYLLHLVSGDTLTVKKLAIVD